MPIASQFHADIGAIKTPAHLDFVVTQLWAEHSQGRVTDDDAQVAAEALQARRAVLTPKPIDKPLIAPGTRCLPRAMFAPRRRRCISPDKLASRQRRRDISLCGCMPFALERRFTEGQRAVLAIVAAEVKANGVCGLCLDAIAARAGVSPNWARLAMRLAGGDGLITIEVRRQRGAKNLPNLVRIVSREWLAWIRAESDHPVSASYPQDLK
jgi:hypothetical protein